MGKLLNFEYSCIHGTYWMFYGVISSFASVFLLARDYSNWEIGVTLAVANVLAVVLQPVIADFADRTRRISLIGITEIIAVLMMLTAGGLFIIQGKTVALSVIFILLIAWHTVLQPVLNSLAFKLEESGFSVYFGIARSMGSLAYAALVAILGSLVEHHGIMVLPVTGEIVLILLMVSLIFTKKCFANAKKSSCKAEAATARRSDVHQTEEAVNFVRFIRKNKFFFVINIGVIGLYFSNSILNNYMMQIVDVVGGDSEDMGIILSVMAFCEIPTMVCFDFLRRKFSYQMMIKVGAIGYTVKIAMCYIANSVSVVLLAQVFQLVSFALFLPAMVHFIDEIMTRGEAVKGQALFTTMITVTTVFSSLAGGAILDMAGAKVLTLIATIATAIGAVLIITTIDKIKSASPR